MRQLAYLAAAVLFVLCSACSHRVWQDSAEITPISYQIPKGQDKRSVGLLRRLAIVPIRFLQGHDIWDWSTSENLRAAGEASVQRALLSQTINLLSSLGYDVVPLEIYEDIYQEKLTISPAEMQDYLDVLAEWASTFSDGEEPPENVANIVSKIGRPLNVDGLVVIEGLTKPPNITGVLAVLTASLSWPLIFLEGKSELRTDIYEVSSGRIVWRSRVRDVYGGAPNMMLGRLFDQLEGAVPLVGIDR
ncbi:MAG: hypothetical protein ACE5FB_01955 [Candidatus Binatia bacterium]